MGSVKHHFSLHILQGSSLPFAAIVRSGQVRRHCLPARVRFPAASLDKLVPSARAVRPSAASERIVGPSAAVCSARAATLAFPATAWQGRAFFHPKSNHSVKRTPYSVLRTLPVAAYLRR